MESIKIDFDGFTYFIIIICFGRSNYAHALSVGKTHIAVVYIAHKCLVVKNAMKLAAFFAKVNAFGTNRYNHFARKLTVIVNILIRSGYIDSSVGGFAFNKINFAYKSRNKLVRRMAIYLHRRADLLYNTVIDNNNLVRHCHCFNLVMSNINNTYAKLSLNRLDFKSHAFTKLCVKV